MEGKLETMLKGIDKAELRPWQKLVMLEMYALPKIAFPLTQEHNTKGTLLKLDRLVHEYVKRWIRLPDSTCNAVFHSGKSHGEMGLPEMTKAVPAQRINNLRALKTSSDLKIRRMAEVMNIDALIEKYAKMGKSSMPSTETGKAKWRHLPLQDWSNLKVAGQGVKDFEGKCSNSWTASNAQYFGEADYNTALQLWTNTFPCRATKQSRQ